MAKYIWLLSALCTPITLVILAIHIDGYTFSDLSRREAEILIISGITYVSGWLFGGIGIASYMLEVIKEVKGSDNA